MRIVCLGSTYYSHSPLVYRVRDISDLSDALWRAIKKGSGIYSDREEEWLWFIYNVISTCGKGKFVGVRPPYGFPDDRENAKKMASFIAKKIRRDLTNRPNT